MSSPRSRSDSSSAFERLDPKIQQWVWRNEWQELREIQERAVAPILDRSHDLIVAAATAAGKTEAAFLPIASSLRQDPIEAGIGALYISPLKALINDQHQRLELLCRAAEIELARWHGDVSANEKRAVREQPRGILLITPESLESIFVNHGSSAPKIFGALRYVVIDELHAFIGSERGRQLQSILHRIELCGRRSAMRVGLSATLGDMAIAAEFMRPGSGQRVTLIESADDSRTLMVQLRGYVARPAPTEPQPEHADSSPDGDRLEVTDHLYEVLRGSDNLVFANSRRSVEEFADLLRRRCESDRVPIEFFPHHGSLSKALREDVEQRLRDRSQPATAICTSTLELGIDVGSVTCVGQIDPPFSAAALRQRLGRSGRRPDDPSILRMYVTESELGPGAAPSDELREGLVQSIALIEALIDGWFEPPIDGALHLSTLIQQLLSVIAQHGGALADDVWMALCGSGPFELDRQDFVKLLRGLAERDVIQQSGDRELILTPRGEQIVGHYSFYSAFTTPEEYRLIADEVELGTMPISSPLREDSYLIFGGRRWRVVEVDDERRVIVVVRAKGGKVPRFFGETGELHDEIRRRMREIYAGDSVPPFLDARAKDLLAQARGAFRTLGLDRRQIVDFEAGSAFFPWKGDRVTATLALGLRAGGLSVEAEGQALIVRDAPPERLRSALVEAFGLGNDPDPVQLAGTVKNIEVEKHHWLLDPDLLLRDCATARLDVDGAKLAVRELASEPAVRAAHHNLENSPGSTPEGFVVVDCETTGLHPGAHHRIVELALLTTDEGGEIVDRWSTLLRPDRDLGPTDIHGIRAREVADAPRFVEVLGEITDRLPGRVLVAHNARFDQAFLESELARAGIEVSPLPMLCTMELARRLSVGGVRRRLGDCRDSLGLTTDGAHTALVDAEVAAAILARYLDRFASYDALVKGKVLPPEAWPASGQRAKPKPRQPAFAQPLESSSLTRLIAAAELPPGREGSDEAAYLELLDRAIEDRHLDTAEGEELVALARTLGIDREALDGLHRDYLNHLVALAHRDGEVTAREREDLYLVSKALGIEGLEAKLEHDPAPARATGQLRGTGLAGHTVCFTGALTCQHDGELLTRERATTLATAAGLTVLPRVTKKLDVLVLADPDSTSGKARQAREYGVRLIAETAFWETIGVEVR